MRVAVYSSEAYEMPYLIAAAVDTPIQWHWLRVPLTVETVPLAQACDAVCAFVTDRLDATVLTALKALGVQLILVRAAGFNNVDVQAGHALALTMARVAAYSPYAVAEHALALLLAVIRKPCLSNSQLKQGDARLSALLGDDIHGKTVGVIGTGRIGSQFAKLLTAFGCRLLAYDQVQNPDCIASGVSYVTLETLLSQSDIVSIHCPLTAQTHHLLDTPQLNQMKAGAVLINTARGGLINTQSLIEALESGHLRAAGLDVIENEASVFFADHRHTGIPDALIKRLVNLPNVMVTPHQAFLTKEALTNIARGTVANILGWLDHSGIPSENQL